jgi:hypothetical protein
MGEPLPSNHEALGPIPSIEKKKKDLCWGMKYGRGQIWFQVKVTDEHLKIQS